MVKAMLLRSNLFRSAPSADCSDRRCNTLSWIPTDVGRYRFKLVARDSEENESELAWEVTVTVPEPNGLPYFTSSPETIARVANSTSTVLEQMIRIEEDVLVFSLAVSPEAMTIDGETGEVRWEPTRQDLGFQTVVVQVSDGKGVQPLKSSSWRSSMRGRMHPLKSRAYHRRKPIRPFLTPIKSLLQTTMAIRLSLS